MSAVSMEALKTYSATSMEAVVSKAAVDSTLIVQPAVNGEEDLTEAVEATLLLKIT